MYEIISSGKSPGEAKIKGIVSKILLTEDNISLDMAIKIIKMIGVCVIETESGK